MARINQWGNSVCNLQYGTGTRLVRGMYYKNDILFSIKMTQAYWEKGNPSAPMRSRT